VLGHYYVVANGHCVEGRDLVARINARGGFDVLDLT